LLLLLLLLLLLVNEMFCFEQNGERVVGGETILSVVSA
jgi:hypothetical protein